MKSICTSLGEESTVYNTNPCSSNIFPFDIAYIKTKQAAANVMGALKDMPLDDPAVATGAATAVTGILNSGTMSEEGLVSKNDSQMLLFI